MKKMLLFAAAATLSTLSYAQTAQFTAKKTTPVNFSGLNIHSSNPAGTAAKTTAVGDTVYISHISETAGTDTLTYYSYVNDTGAVFGINAFGDKGYAERYNVDAATVSYKVLGVVARFSGVYQPTTTKQVTFNCWTVGPKTSIGTGIYNSGMPATVLASRTKSITMLGIGVGADNDTAMAHVFTTPTAYLTDTFFVGYNIDYTWAGAAGDTIGLYTNLDGERGEALGSVAPGDTTFNNVSVNQKATGDWVDNVVSPGVRNNLAIFPIVIVGPGTASTKGINRNDFTFFGTFPNPASNSTNVKIALANKADVTVEVMDMSGRHINTINSNNLTAGEHTIAINTTDLASGQYLILVRTSTGNGIASQITVIK